MTGITKHLSLIVVAALAILFIAFAVPPPAQSDRGKDPSLGAQASSSSEPDEAIGKDDDASLVPKGRHGGANTGSQTQQTTQNNTKKQVTNKLKNTQGFASTSSGSHATSVRSGTGKSAAGTASAISSHSTAKDLAKIQSLSIGSQSQGKPISLATQSPSGTSSVGGKSISGLSGGSGVPAPGLVAGSNLTPTGPGGLGIKTGPVLSGTGIKTAPGPGGTTSGNTSGTQGDVTGGGKGSVTSGGVQSVGGSGNQTQGNTISTGGGNTVGGIQQSGTGNTVDVNQTTNNVTNVTKVSGGGGGGGGFGGGGGGEVAAVDVSSSEPVAEPVVVTRVVPAAPSDSCPTVVELNQMGFSYYQAGTYTSAEDAFKRALAVLDTQACKNKPLKATTLENLAFTFDKLGKHDEAVKYQEQAQLLRRMQ